MSLPVLRSSPSAGQAGPSKAAQACGTCRKQKRRCDKALPSCSLCVRMRRPCDYTEANPQPTAEDFTAMQMRLIELESRLNSGRSSVSAVGDTPPPPSHMSSNPSLFPPDPIWPPQTPLEFPTEVFLDYSHWQRFGQPIPKPPVDIPGEVLTLLGDGDAIQQAIIDYFNTVHVWLPIISKRRMHSGISLSGGGPDLAMLFLAVKLVSTSPLDGVPASDLYVYTTAKRFLYMLEHSGFTSIMVLQSMVLVAIYEFGHGIYPAAWMTVGACCRMVEFLGLPAYRESSYVLSPAQTMVELEERRRTWWAVVVLDRIICLGSQRRNILPDPPKYEALPVEDDVWDDGDLSLATQRSYDGAFTGSSSPFARLCEVSFLISRTLACVRAIPTEQKTLMGSYSMEEYMSLYDDINHASSVLESEAAAAIASYSHSSPYNSSPSQYSGLSISNSSSKCPNPFLPAQSLLLSAKIQLQEIYSGPTTYIPQTNEEAESQHQSILGLTRSADHVLDVLYGSLPFQSSSPAATSSMSHLSPYQQRDMSSRGGATSGRNSPVPVDRTLCAANPFILDALYSSATKLAYFIKEGRFSSSSDGVNKLEAARGFLARLNGRWRVAGEYIRVLDRQSMGGIPLMTAGP